MNLPMNNLSGIEDAGFYTNRNDLGFTANVTSIIHNAKAISLADSNGI